MDWTKGFLAAGMMKAILLPFCKRIEIAGSIRREKEQVNDVELVVIADGCRLEQFFINVHYHPLYIFKKFGPKWKQYYYEGVKYDVFITNENHWGWIYLLRTGSQDFSKRVAIELKKAHYTMEEGRILDPFQKEVICKTEEEVFALINQDFILPKNRL